jgi:hypothetical protein
MKHGARRALRRFVPDAAPQPGRCGMRHYSQSADDIRSTIGAIIVSLSGLWMQSARHLRLIRV